MYAVALRTLALIAVVAACGGRRYGTPPEGEDTRHLYVEIETRGRHDDALREGAEIGLSAIRYAVPVDRSGDVVLQVELVSLDVVGNESVCQLKLLVLRASTNDLLGIADGTARARGTHDEAGDDCISSLGANLIKTKVRQLLNRQLQHKK